MFFTFFLWMTTWQVTAQVAACKTSYKLIGVQKVEHVPKYDLVDAQRERLPDGTVRTISFKAWNSTYVVQLQRNNKIISPHMTSVVRDGNSSISFKGFPSHINTDCHFHGQVISHNNEKAAISDCIKLMGVIVNDDHFLMLQTIPHRFHQENKQTPKHLVYKREAALINPMEHFVEAEKQVTTPSFDSVFLSRAQGSDEDEEFCDISKSMDVDLHFESKAFAPAAATRLESVFALNYTLPSEAKLDSLFIFPQLDPITLEIGLFLDSQLYEHFKREFTVDPEQHLTDFSLALINNVHVLYQQPTLSPNLDIVIVHFEMWKTQPSALATELHKNGQAQTLLDSFCRHQARINPASDLTDPNHWDHGVLLTGYDIYHTTASVAGVAPVGRMCDDLFACSLVEGLHLGRSFVLAHEMGHNMGMVHDGVQNQCGRSCCLMSAVNGAGKTTWSTCSVREFNSFLLQLDESGRGNCLRDPAESIASHDHLKDGRLPGQRFTADQQCSYFWGRDYQVEIPNGRIFEDICRILWCGNNGSTISTAHPALEGSWCGGTKWCHEGKCEQWNMLSTAPTVVNGEWSDWSSVDKQQCPITPCQITGSIALKSQLRTCTNPAPNNGGANCFGSNVRGLLCGQAKSTCEGFTRQEFGDRLCAAIRNDPSRPDRQLSGQSFAHTSQPCKIWCHVRDSELIRNKGQFPNGSPCGVEQYCVSGTCLSLSCNKQAVVSQTSDCPPPVPTNVRNKQSKWDSWAVWSQCSVTCGDHGVQKRLRKCRSPDSECAGKSSEVRPCEPIPPRCQPYSEWTSWTECSETCGPSAKRKRTRNCLSDNCDSKLLEELENCKEVKCPEWEAWQDWSICSAHCGQGERQRTRICSVEGTCQGDSHQLASCFEKPCRNDGWSEWMPCSVSCGIGFQLRERHCNGQLCPENSKQARTCNVQDCSKIKTNALLSQWSLWGACSKTCGQGFQHRHRKCLNGICSAEQVLSEQKRCVLGPCPAWQAWQPWSACSSCSVFETRRRARKCMVQIVGVGGVEQDTEVDHTSCSGVPIEYDTCERSCLDEPDNDSASSAQAHGVETSSGLATPIIPLDTSNGLLLPKGNWLAWQDWLPCSAACGQGLRQRIRFCPDGQDCSTTGLSFEIEACNIQPCSSTPSMSNANSWSEWQDWSHCSKSCGGGRQMRTRKCLASLIFLCDGYAKEERPCNTKACGAAHKAQQNELRNAIPEWSDWSDWSKCSCFTLNKFRRRYCKIIDPAMQGFCSGAIIQQQACEPSSCVSESGGWSDWSEWSKCSRECGINGHQIRNRMCSNPLPSNRGSYCVGYSFDQRPCQPQLTCEGKVVDGQWSKWTNWSVCSDPCVNGQRSRTRYCSEPRPENGGQQCIGSDFELQACSEPTKCSSSLSGTPAVAVHGRWDQWSTWSNCSSSCGFSFQSRSRLCSSPPPSNGGKVCIGLAYMTSVCSRPYCSDSTDGQWAEWSEWTSCSTTNCDGTRTRVRECNQPAPSTNGLPCFGRSSQTSKCPSSKMNNNLLDARFCQSNWVANVRLVETSVTKVPR